MNLCMQFCTPLYFSEWCSLDHPFLPRALLPPSPSSSFSSISHSRFITSVASSLFPHFLPFTLCGCSKSVLINLCRFVLILGERFPVHLSEDPSVPCLLIYLLHLQTFFFLHLILHHLQPLFYHPFLSLFTRQAIKDITLIN